MSPDSPIFVAWTRSRTALANNHPHDLGRGEVAPRHRDVASDPRYNTQQLDGRDRPPVRVRDRRAHEVFLNRESLGDRP